MWQRAWLNFTRSVAQVVFPNACLVCDVAEGEGQAFRHGLCRDCFASLTADPLPSCPRCALSIGPYSVSDGGCSACRGESLGFDAAVRLGRYEGIWRQAVLRMKSGAGEGLAELMGRVYYAAANARLRTEGLDFVVPIPLHWARRWRRGYNQSAAFGRELAVELGLTFLPRLLRRIRHTPQQSQPSASARRENVRGAFQVRPDARIRDRTILLVDDVMTTGSTAGEAARTLKAAGAERIVVAVIARK